jgi:hypothetical protein
MAEARRAHPQSPRPLAQPRRQSCPQFEPCILNAGTVALSLQQAEGSRRLLDSAQHLPEEGFVLAPADSQSRLRHEVPERQRSGQPLALSPEKCLHFQRYDPMCRLVDGQVMAQPEHQPALIGRVVGDDAAHERSPPHIEPDDSWIKGRSQPARHIDGRIYLHFIDCERGLAPDHLDGLRQPLPNYRRSQNVVPRNDRVQRSNEIIQLPPRVERQQERQQVDVSLCAHQVMEEYSLL